MFFILTLGLKLLIPALSRNYIISHAKVVNPDPWVKGLGLVPYPEVFKLSLVCQYHTPEVLNFDPEP